MSLHDSLNVLEELCATPGVAGFEEPIIRLVKRLMTQYTDDVRIDRLGNVIGTMRAQREDAQTLLIAAHIDEIGFVVRHITPNGFLRVYRVGYPLDRVLPSTPMAVHSDDGKQHFAIFGVKSHHSSTPEERFTVTPADQGYIDAGFRSASEVEAAAIRVGSPVTWWPNFRVLGDTVISKTLDNRLCVLAMLKTMENLRDQQLPVNVAFLGTMQEEFSHQGGAMAARTIKPDMAVAIDVTISMDTPDLEDTELSEATFGSGIAINRFGYHPVIPFVGTLIHQKLCNQMITTAETHQIPFVRTISSRIMTDASSIQHAEGGVPVVELGIPTRYTHSPTEMATLADAQAAIDLMTHFVLDLPPDIDLTRG